MVVGDADGEPPASEAVAQGLGGADCEGAPDALAQGEGEGEAQGEGEGGAESEGDTLAEAHAEAAAEPEWLSDAEPLTEPEPDSVAEREGEADGEASAEALPLGVAAGVSEADSQALPLGEAEAAGESDSEVVAHGEAESEALGDGDCGAEKEAQLLGEGEREALAEGEKEALAQALCVESSETEAHDDADGAPLREAEGEALGEALGDCDGASDADAHSVALRLGEAVDESECEPEAVSRGVSVSETLPLCVSEAAGDSDSEVVAQGEAESEALGDGDCSAENEPQLLGEGEREALAEGEKKALAQALCVESSETEAHDDADGAPLREAEGEALGEALGDCDGASDADAHSVALRLGEPVDESECEPEAVSRGVSVSEPLPLADAEAPALCEALPQPEPVAPVEGVAGALPLWQRVPLGVKLPAAEAEASSDADALCEPDAVASCEAESVDDGLLLGEAGAEGDGEPEWQPDAEPDCDAEGGAECDLQPLADAEGEALGEGGALALSELWGLPEPVAAADGEALTEALGDGEGSGDAVAESVALGLGGPGGLPLGLPEAECEGEGVASADALADSQAEAEGGGDAVPANEVAAGEVVAEGQPEGEGDAVADCDAEPHGNAVAECEGLPEKDGAPLAELLSVGDGEALAKALGDSDALRQAVAVAEQLGEGEGEGEPVGVAGAEVAAAVALPLEQGEAERERVSVPDAEGLREALRETVGDLVAVLRAEEASIVLDRDGLLDADLEVVEKRERDGELEGVENRVVGSGEALPLVRGDAERERTGERVYLAVALRADEAEPQALADPERLGWPEREGEADVVESRDVGPGDALPLEHGEAERERVSVPDLEGLGVALRVIEGDLVTVAGAEVAAVLNDAVEQRERDAESVTAGEGEDEPVGVTTCVVGIPEALPLDCCEAERERVGERVTLALTLCVSDMVPHPLIVLERMAEPERDGVLENDGRPEVGPGVLLALVHGEAERERVSVPDAEGLGVLLRDIVGDRVAELAAEELLDADERLESEAEELCEPTREAEPVKVKGAVVGMADLLIREDGEILELREGKDVADGLGVTLRVTDGDRVLVTGALVAAMDFVAEPQPESDVEEVSERVCEGDTVGVANCVVGRGDLLPVEHEDEVCDGVGVPVGVTIRVVASGEPLPVEHNVAERDGVGERVALTQPLCVSDLVPHSLIVFDRKDEAELVGERVMLVQPLCDIDVVPHSLVVLDRMAEPVRDGVLENDGRPEVGPGVLLALVQGEEERDRVSVPDAEGLGVTLRDTVGDRVADLAADELLDADERLESEAEELCEPTREAEPVKVKGAVVGMADLLIREDGEILEEREGKEDIDGLDVTLSVTVGDRVLEPGAEVAAIDFVAETLPDCEDETVGERDCEGETVGVTICVVGRGDLLTVEQGDAECDGEGEPEGVTIRVVASGEPLPLEHCDAERERVGERVALALPLCVSDLVPHSLGVLDRIAEPERDGVLENDGKPEVGPGVLLALVHGEAERERVSVPDAEGLRVALRDTVGDRVAELAAEELLDADERLESEEEELGEPAREEEPVKVKGAVVGMADLLILGVGEDLELRDGKDVADGLGVTLTAAEGDLVNVTDVDREFDRLDEREILGVLLGDFVMVPVKLALPDRVGRPEAEDETETVGRRDVGPAERLALEHGDAERERAPERDAKALGVRLRVTEGDLVTVPAADDAAPLFVNDGAPETVNDEDAEPTIEKETVNVNGAVVGIADLLILEDSETLGVREGDGDADGLGVTLRVAEGERVLEPGAEVAAMDFVADEHPEIEGDAAGEREGKGELESVTMRVVACGVALPLDTCEAERERVGERVTLAQALKDSEAVEQALAPPERLGEPVGERDPVTVASPDVGPGDALPLGHGEAERERVSVPDAEGLREALRVTEGD